MSLLTPQIGDPNRISVLGADNRLAAKMACLLHSTPHPHPTPSFASDMLACYTDNFERSRRKKAACNMLGRNCNNNVLFSSCPVMGHQQHRWWEGRPGSAQSSPLGWEEMGLERRSMELRVSCRCAVLYLGLDVGSQTRVRQLLESSLSLPRRL
jgi:hypothetical protein